MEQEFKEQKSPLEISDDLTSTRIILKEMIRAHNASSKKSRERSVVITKLQEAEMWALEAISKE